MEYGYKIYPSRSSAFGMTYTHGADSLDRMEDQGERLSRAIKDAGLTLRDASDRFGWSYNTLKSNANGNATFSYKRAQVYAGRLKVRAEWLYDGALPIKEAAKAKRRPVDVPVIGWVQAGQLTDASVVHDVPELEIVAADGLGLGEWFATDVMGDSMDRVSPDGSRIFVNAAERALVNGGYYLFSLRGRQPTSAITVSLFSGLNHSLPILPTKSFFLATTRIGLSSVASIEALST